MASGIRAMFGTDTKTLHAGRAAQNGIVAATLAQKGFSSCGSPIEAWAHLVSSVVDEDAISALANGGPWQILENTFKPYPCGIVIHPVIDGALQMFDAFGEQGIQMEGKQAGPKSIEDVGGIDVVVTPQCVRLCNVRHPRNGLETIFSLYHGIAVALVHGRAGPAEFSDAVASGDVSVARFRELVVVKTDDALRDDEAWLHFTSISDPDPSTRTKSIHISHATGSLSRPMTPKQLEQKFLDQATRCLGITKAKASLEMSVTLESMDDIGAFVDLLAL